MVGFEPRPSGTSSILIGFKPCPRPFCTRICILISLWCASAGWVLAGGSSPLGVSCGGACLGLPGVAAGVLGCFVWLLVVRPLRIRFALGSNTLPFPHRRSHRYLGIGPRRRIACRWPTRCRKHIWDKEACFRPGCGDLLRDMELLVNRVEEESKQV